MLFSRKNKLKESPDNACQQSTLEAWKLQMRLQRNLDEQADNDFRSEPLEKFLGSINRFKAQV